MKFVKIRGYYINSEKINYVSTSVYLESYHIEIYFNNDGKFVSFTTKSIDEFNEWIFLLTGKEFEEK